MELLEPVDPKVLLKVRGLRKDASTLNEKNVHVGIDVSRAGAGEKIVPITRDQIILPNERIYVINIDPSRMMFHFKVKPEFKEQNPSDGE